MTGNQIRTAYIDFFKEKKHKQIPSAPLVPENDPTTLFTGSGMQPLINYFLGEKHPLGKRIVDAQKCFRAEDIDEVGDNRHTTFFEMLGNWSLGDYFKDDQLHWIYDFFTKIVGLDTDNLCVTVFEGNKYAPKDDEAILLWQDIFETKTSPKPGMSGFDPKVKIYEYDQSKNWWSRSGEPQEMPVGEPGGTTSEIFYLFENVEHNKEFGEVCHPNCDCGRFLEIGNSVFMEYKKEADSTFSKLPNNNIDFGGGLERIAAASNNDPDVFTTDLFEPIIREVEVKSGQKYEVEYKYPMRLIADHLRGAVMMMAEGIEPSNKAQGYVVRRLLRRSIMQVDGLHIKEDFLYKLVPFVADYFNDIYPEVKGNENQIQEWVKAEETKFKKVISQGKKKLFRQMDCSEDLDMDELVQMMFDLFQSHGLPLEISHELAKQRLEKLMVNDEELKSKFQLLKDKHADKSRSTDKGSFKGGLADHSEVIVKYHTATHLLHQALRDVLGEQIQQMGSNITNERLRFDFKHSQKMTEQEVGEVTDIINQKIAADLPVYKTIEPLDKALESGALAFFKENYPEKVSVYTIGKDKDKDWYSKELCGGPHVSSTGEIGPVTIKKEQAVGPGIRRVYVALV